MRVSEVKIYPFDVGQAHSKLLAFAEVTLDNSLTLRGFRIFRSEAGGLFIGYPSQKGKDGDYRDLLLVKDADLRKHLREAILDAYRNLA